VLVANLVSPFVAREEKSHRASDRTCPPSGGGVRDSDAAYQSLGRSVRKKKRFKGAAYVPGALTGEAKC
jgi:hypothetical protein